MEQITRKDLFIHAYLNAGYDPDQAIIMADGVIALMAQEKSKETPVSKPQDDWMPAIADDVLYFFRTDNFKSTWAFQQYGADLSLIDKKVRIRSKGVGNPMVNVHAYGKTNVNHTIDTLVFDVVTPNRGVWIHYNTELLVGVDFESGALQRVNYQLMPLKESEICIGIKKGDRLILEVKRNHRRVDVFLENYTNGQGCELSIEDEDIQYAEYNTMDIVFSEEVITEIDMCYLDCGLLQTKCCAPYEFIKRIDCDIEERDYFRTKEFKREHVILVDSPNYIAYSSKVSA